MYAFLTSTKLTHAKTFLSHFNAPQRNTLLVLLISMEIPAVRSGFHYEVTFVLCKPEKSVCLAKEEKKKSMLNFQGVLGISGGLVAWAEQQPPYCRSFVVPPHTLILYAWRCSTLWQPLLRQLTGNLKVFQNSFSVFPPLLCLSFVCSVKVSPHSFSLSHSLPSLSLSLNPQRPPDWHVIEGWKHGVKGIQKQTTQKYTCVSMETHC